MLGEMIDELRHKSTGTRAIKSNVDVGVEESFQGSDKILGVERTDIRTVSAFGLCREGNGIIMRHDNEVATYARHGIGWPSEKGGHTIRAAMLFKTTSQRLERLNKVIVVSELEEETE